MAREKLGRNACSAFLIIDAQSVKNADTAGLKGYDPGKKVSGIKRHIAVDTQGLPHAIAVTTAEVTGREGALQGVKDILGAHVSTQVARRSELHTFKVMPKRWIGERGFAWLDRYNSAQARRCRAAVARLWLRKLAHATVPCHLIAASNYFRRCLAAS